MSRMLIVPLLLDAGPTAKLWRPKATAFTSCSLIRSATT